MEKKGRTTVKEQLYGIIETRNIEYVQFGVDLRFPTWYGSTAYFQQTTRHLGLRDPDGRRSRCNSAHLPDEKEEKVKKSRKRELSTPDCWLETLYVCEFCFKYTDVADELKEHASQCQFRDRAPGRIQYRTPELSIRKVSGSRYLLFCQCLCLFTKLFLDNKSMYFKVEHYDFYIAYSNLNNKPMAFFSKDLTSFQKNNLACILTLPPYQRKGLGTLLMDFSYKLSVRDRIVSGPEQPLSPFGLAGYLKYWSTALCLQFLDGPLQMKARVGLKDISKSTGMRLGDIVLTLQSLECLSEKNEISLQALRRWIKNNKQNTNAFVNDNYLILDD
ncbi:LAFA_0F11496g1_1 [Lachancea sp. 'fantastica']|nr:LAFA_0F11496g1_1 [Lachancea sp. 'fantastica']